MDYYRMVRGMKKAEAIHRLVDELKERKAEYDLLYAKYHELSDAVIDCTVFGYKPSDVEYLDTTIRRLRPDIEKISELPPKMSYDISDRNSLIRDLRYGVGNG